jgi:hypothetical protein
MENELSWEQQRDEWENLMAILVSSHDRWEQVAKMLPHWKNEIDEQLDNHRYGMAIAGPHVKRLQYPPQN